MTLAPQWRSLPPSSVKGSLEWILLFSSIVVKIGLAIRWKECYIKHVLFKKVPPVGLFLLNSGESPKLSRLHEEIVARLQQLIIPIAESRNTYLIDISIRGDRGGKVVEIFLDADRGVSSDTCAAVSRELSRLLDTADLINGSYQLIVSSPGLDRPLKLARQYPKHVGRRLDVLVRISQESKKVEGILSGVTELGIELTLADGRLFTAPFDQVVEARVLPAW